MLALGRWVIWGMVSLDSRETNPLSLQSMIMSFVYQFARGIHSHINVDNRQQLYCYGSFQKAGICNILRLQLQDSVESQNTRSLVISRSFADSRKCRLNHIACKEMNCAFFHFSFQHPGRNVCPSTT